MAKLKDKKIVTDLGTLSQVAQTGVSMGWKARDTLCHDRYCTKCSRKDHHHADMPKATRVRLGNEIGDKLYAELERQAAARRYLGGRGLLHFDANALEYDEADEQEPNPN
jgi:hypothetical protein